MQWGIERGRLHRMCVLIFIHGVVIHWWIKARARGHFITIDYTLPPASVVWASSGCVFYVRGYQLWTLVLTCNTGDNNTLIICAESKHCQGLLTPAWWVWWLGKPPGWSSLLHSLAPATLARGSEPRWAIIWCQWAEVRGEEVQCDHC